MTNASFLEGDPDELEERLLTVARRERAPIAARERALASVAAASLSVAVASSAKAGAAVASSGGVLATKWLAIGLGGALVGLTAVDQVQRAFTPAEVPAAMSGAAAPGAVLAPAAPGAFASAPAASSMPLASSADAVPHAQRSVVVVAAEPAAAALAPSSADFDTPDATSLAREVMALRQARAALAAGEPQRALEILVAHRREHPVGVLGTEEAALRVEIAFALGDALAPERARRFLNEHAHSPLAARVRSLLEAKR